MKNFFEVSDRRDPLDRLDGLRPDAARRWGKTFFGRMAGDEWGVLMYKHLDQHLRQFGA